MEITDHNCHPKQCNKSPCSSRSPSCSSVCDSATETISTPSKTPLPNPGAVICPYDNVSQNVDKKCHEQTLGKLTYLELKNLINDVVQSNMTNCLGGGQVGFPEYDGIEENLRESAIFLGGGTFLHSL